MKNAREVLGAMVAGTDGVLAAGLLGMDGAPIEVLKLDAGFPAESVGKDVVTAAKLFLYMCRKAEGGSFDHMMMSCERFTVLAAVPGLNHCVALFLSNKGNLGKARVQFRRYLPELVGAVESAAG
jgi:predicted regulator of Ras-like GTPase activity (Roadblock/LC7/MglB family)